ncbi:HAD hydrolase family protein [Massilimicrobiota timonensis]
MDGTLIDMTKKKISKKILETMKRLKNNGIKLCVATGR